MADFLKFSMKRMISILILISLSTPAYAATGISSIGALWEGLFYLVCLGVYILVFAFIVFNVKGVFKYLFLAFVVGAFLFLPPFSFGGKLNFTYLKPVDNIPQNKKVQTVTKLDQFTLKTDKGEIIDFSENGRNPNYWNVIENDTPIIIEQGPKDYVTVIVYHKKRDHEFRRSSTKKIYIPIFPQETPLYRVLRLEGGKVK